MSVFFLYCRTGCTCCSDDNHYRGPYATEEDAKRRAAFFLDPKAVNNPVASQFAPKGRYEISEEDVEYLLDGRAIVARRVYDELECITVQPDGSTLLDDRFYMEE